MYLEPTTKRFLFSQGNLQMDEHYYGLYASQPDSKYAISSFLGRPLDPAPALGHTPAITLEFKALKE